jgi:hypothetical protein
MTIIKTSALQFSASPSVRLTIATQVSIPLTHDDASGQSPVSQTVSPALDCQCEEPVEPATKSIEEVLQQPPDLLP